ncbi:MAG: hypothetical protein R3C59_10685 [Planctomycetaceae bacterium]
MTRTRETSTTVWTVSDIDDSPQWYDYGSSGDVDRIKYGYDRSGSRLCGGRTWWLDR